MKDPRDEEISYLKLPYFRKCDSNVNSNGADLRFEFTMESRVFDFEFSQGTWTTAVQVEKMVKIMGADGDRDKRPETRFCGDWLRSKRQIKRAYRSSKVVRPGPHQKESGSIVSFMDGSS